MLTHPHPPNGTAPKTGLCVDIPFTGPPAVDASVHQWYCARGGGDNQEFYLRYQHTNEGYGVYLLENAKGLCLDLPGFAWVPEATPVYTHYCRPSGDNQLWRLEARYVNGAFYGYWLRNFASGLCLDVPGAGYLNARLEVYPCNASTSDDHYWIFL